MYKSDVLEISVNGTYIYTPPPGNIVHMPQVRSSENKEFEREREIFLFNT